MSNERLGVSASERRALGWLSGAAIVVGCYNLATGRVVIGFSVVTVGVEGAYIRFLLKS